FATTLPAINISFVPSDPDMMIQGADGNSQVAAGSGKLFAISFKNPNSRKAKSDGFAVLVNGELRQNKDLVNSFSKEAIIPRALGPVPCGSVFTANRQYEIFRVSEKRKGKAGVLFVGPPMREVGKDTGRLEESKSVYKAQVIGIMPDAKPVDA